MGDVERLGLLRVMLRMGGGDGITQVAVARCGDGGYASQRECGRCRGRTGGVARRRSTVAQWWCGAAAAHSDGGVDRQRWRGGPSGGGESSRENKKSETGVRGRERYMTCGPCKFL
jgi:hypothetical protein